MWAIVSPWHCSSVTASCDTPGAFAIPCSDKFLQCHSWSSNTNFCMSIWSPWALFVYYSHVYFRPYAFLDLESGSTNPWHLQCAVRAGTFGS